MSGTIVIRGGNVISAPMANALMKLAPSNVSGEVSFAESGLLDDGTTVSTTEALASATLTVTGLATAGTMKVGSVTAITAGALWEGVSTTAGILPPRMTTAQRDAIATPPEGLVIYNLSTHALNVYNGSWLGVTAA